MGRYVKDVDVSLGRQTDNRMVGLKSSVVQPLVCVASHCHRTRALLYSEHSGANSLSTREAHF